MGARICSADDNGYPCNVANLTKKKKKKLSTYLTFKYDFFPCLCLLLDI